MMCRSAMSKPNRLSIAHSTHSASSSSTNIQNAQSRIGPKQNLFVLASQMKLRKPPMMRHAWTTIQLGPLPRSPMPCNWHMTNRPRNSCKCSKQCYKQCKANEPQIKLKRLKNVLTVASAISGMMTVGNWRPRKQSAQQIGNLLQREKRMTDDGVWSTRTQSSGNQERLKLIKSVMVSLT